MHKIEGPGATVDNRFTEGNPSTGVPATTVTDDFMNAVQDELVNVIEGAGLTLETAATETGSQLLQALQALGLGGYASEAEAQALTSLTKILTPGRLNDAFKGGNQSLSPNGWQKLPGGLFLQWMNGNFNNNQSYSLPIAYPNGNLGIGAFDNGTFSNVVTANVTGNNTFNFIIGGGESSTQATVFSIGR